MQKFSWILYSATLVYANSVVVLWYLMLLQLTLLLLFKSKSTTTRELVEVKEEKSNEDRWNTVAFLETVGKANLYLKATMSFTGDG